MQIRPVRQSELEALGELTLGAYAALPGRPLSDGYAALLRDVAARVRETEVLVAVEGTRLLGGVTYVGDAASSYAEFRDPAEACFRMLAVAPEAQGAGVGAALVAACIERARGDGKRRLSLLTTPSMAPAHRLYERLGFRRAPGSDIMVDEELQLRSYVLDL